MGRSNKAARQRNHRLNRRAKGESRPIVRDQSTPRIPVDELVIPDGMCMANPRKPKAFFSTETKARKALEQAQRVRARMGSGHVEKRYYKCDHPVRNCGGYHLTSRESYDAAWKRSTSQEAS